jgi:hypothetical protein
MRCIGHTDGINPFHHSSSGKVGIITYDTFNGIISYIKEACKPPSPSRVEEVDC